MAKKVGRPSKDTHDFHVKVWGENWVKLKDEPNKNKVINDALKKHYKMK